MEQKHYRGPFQIGEPLTGGRDRPGRGVTIARTGSPAISSSLRWDGGEFTWRASSRRLGCAGAGFNKVDPQLGPLRAYLGNIGMPGLSAYVA